MKKTASYLNTNTYETLNQLTVTTKNIWIVFHGIGYLSKYFISYFSTLNAEENYIICPQAPSKYYKGTDYKRIGACWLTRENTTLDTENILNYIDAILEQEQLPKNSNLIVLGYSQGVSIASRWIGKRKRICNKLILVSGEFPKELSKKDFEHLPTMKTIHTVGKNDPIFKPENVLNQELRMQSIFPNIKLINHPGKHKLNTELFSKYLLS